jgi:hypothetical protein
MKAQFNTVMAQQLAPLATQNVQIARQISAQARQQRDFKRAHGADVLARRWSDVVIRSKDIGKKL